MRAIQYGAFGNPTDMLFLKDIPIPEPSAGEVRIRLTHRAINPSDVLTVAGLYGRLPKNLPATPGNEGVGVIDALGEGVTGFSVGQRVIPLNSDGTWKEYVVVNTQWLLPVPDEVSDQTAAQFIVNPVTAWVMLVDELGLQEGDWLLQTAAGSTLGRIVLQIAKLKGYKTVNFVRRQEQVEELKALGADVVICTKDNVVEQVRSATDGKGAKGAIEAVGSSTGTLAMQSLRAGGTMLVYGLLSGQPSELNWGEMLFKGITVKGFWLTHWFRTTPPPQVASTLGELMGLMAQGHLIPPVEAEYDLADIEKAIIHSNTPGRSGKVILTG